MPWRKLIDNNGRVLGKVSVIDIIVVLVIIAIVLLAYLRFSDHSASTHQVEVTFTAMQVRDPIVLQIKTGEMVKDEAGTLLGKIVSTRRRPTREEYVTPMGELKVFDSPLYSDLDIVVAGEAKLAGSTLRIGNQFLRVGRKVTLVGLGFEVSTQITAVKILN